MPNVISVGSALVDIFIHSSHFQTSQDEGVAMLCQRLGEKLEVESFEIFTGGGGSNTSVGFSRCGFAAALVAELGRDAFAELVQSDLNRENVKTDFLIREKKEQTGGSVVLVGQDGGRTALVHRGAASQLDVSDMPDQALAAASWIHLSSTGGQLEVLKAIFAHHGQVGISWNPGGSELKLIGQELPVSEIHVQILILNAEEWASISSHQSALLQHIPEVVVTDGSRGGTLYFQGHSQPFQAQAVKSVDDTGAGDAFAVGYVAAHLSGQDPQVAAEWGVANASSVVQQMGAKAGLLTLSQLQSVRE